MKTKSRNIAEQPETYEAPFESITDAGNMALNAKHQIELAANELRSELVKINPQCGFQVFPSVYFKNAVEILNKLADKCFMSEWDLAKIKIVQDIETCKEEINK